jgi:CBS domain-containing protein
MSAGDKVQRVRIYMREQDTWDHQPLYLAVLGHLRREGATGATVLHGIAGFGPGSGVGASSARDTTGSAPLVVEWVDRATRIFQTLSMMDDMLADALITTEEVNIYRARLRSGGLLGDEKNVGDVMQTMPQTVTQSATLGKVLALMLASNQSIVPVIDDGRKIVGVVTELDIARRSGFRMPLRLLPLLTKDEGNNLLGPLAARPVNDVMNREWRTIQDGAFIPQALVIMIEWSYDQIPVVDRGDALVGLLGWADVLKAVLEQTAGSGDSQHVQTVDQPTPVSLVMQQMVHQISQSERLGVALERLLESPDRYLVVVDTTGRVQGSISDTGVFQQLESTERAPLIEAIQKGTSIKPSQISAANRSLDVVMDRDVPMISPKDSIVDAIRRLMDLRLDRAPVTDEQGKLLGVIARGGLMRALSQESV